MYAVVRTRIAPWITELMGTFLVLVPPPFCLSAALTDPAHSVLYGYHFLSGPSLQGWHHDCSAYRNRDRLGAHVRRVLRRRHFRRTL